MARKTRTWWPDIQDRGRLPNYKEVRDYVAEIIAKEGVEAAHRACDAFERNIGLDRAKLYAAASIVAATKTA